MSFDISKIATQKQATKLTAANLKSLHSKVVKLNTAAVEAEAKQGFDKLAKGFGVKRANEAVAALDVLRRIHEKAVVTVAIKRTAETLAGTKVKPDGTKYKGFREYLELHPVKGCSKSAINRAEKLLEVFNPEVMPETNEVGEPWLEAQAREYLSKGTHLTAENHKAHTAYVKTQVKAKKLPAGTKAADVPMTKESTRTKAQSTGNKLDGMVGRLNNLVSEINEYLNPLKADGSEKAQAVEVTADQVTEMQLQADGLKIIAEQMAAMVKPTKVKASN